MTTFQKTQSFDATQVELANSNLIEASAGTGKTYSIAILALRLVVEKDVRIEQILMVTFTKSAVAELEERIRLFIREADKFINGKDIKDKTIKNIVNSTLITQKRELIKNRLKDAVLLLDETSIFTIHSFCQKTLTEFAFETGQIFGNELLSNQNELLTQAVNEYWRTYVTSIEINLLSGLLDLGLSRGGMVDVVAKSLSGKQFVTELLIDPNADDTKLPTLEIEKIRTKDNIVLFYEENRAELIEKVQSKKGLMKTFGEAVLLSDSFIKVYLLKLNSAKPPAYLAKDFPEFYDVVADFQQSIKDLESYFQGVINWFYKEVITFSIELIQEIKKRKNLLTFDDLIGNLHQAITGIENQDLIRGLQYKYRAVFIDEFQDTDKLQFEIFNTAFGEKTTLFFIGDPKQSIYAFRQADIETYKKAKQGVKHIFSMDKNYRSTEEYIKAMNLFFQPSENFDAFADKGINYEQVKKGQEVGLLTENGENVIPLVFTNCSVKSEIIISVANEIHHVLTTHEINGRPILPSDIGVLVDKKADGIEIKKGLSLLNIPAITIDDSKVLVSEEAKVIFNVLQASLEPNRGNINKALLNQVVGRTVEDILSLNEELELSNFHSFQELWKRNGVYSTLLKFIRKYQLKTILLDGNHANGERMITNIYQVMELLHKYEITKNASPKEVLSWMHQFFEGKVIDGDEFTQRVESDNDAVNIVTIHKSKGLAYPIVFAPFLDMKASFSVRRNIVEFRDEKSETYVFSTDKSDEQLSIYEQQNEPENRRLLYVALTRAIYKCYITNNVRTKQSSLKPFLNALAEVECQDLIQKAVFRENPTEKYIYQKDKIERLARSVDDIPAIDNSWRVLSYSGLNSHHAVGIKRAHKEVFDTVYEEFILKTLPKGSITGEFLHHLFEFSDYTSSNNWERVIGKARKLYTRAYKEDLHQFYLKHISEVMNCQLVDFTKNSFQLNQISNDKKIAEMEFYFKINKFNTSKLNELSSLYELNTDKDYSGMMNGFIDLFFEHNGKYYILDWKSNHLGNDLSCYDTEGTEQAMKDNNYHLQYLIYTVAVKRYLKNRVVGFDYKKHFGGVFYLFLRGVRANEGSGVFYDLPDEQLINQIDAVLET